MAKRAVHLLRPFSQWRNNATTVDEAEDWIRELAAENPDGLFYTPTARAPRRAEELLAGGSVYFVKGVTLFRMPIAALRTQGRWTLILMRRELVRVERLRVGFLRGWRYLEAADAPQDVDLGEDIPDDIEARLDALGVR